MQHPADNLGDLLDTDDEVSVLESRAKTDPPVDVMERKVRIVLEENDNIPPTGQFIAINGRTFVLRPGEETEVPIAVLNVLNDAVQDVPHIDPTTRQVIGYRKRHRFPYRIVQAKAA